MNSMNEWMNETLVVDEKTKWTMLMTDWEKNKFFSSFFCLQSHYFFPTIYDHNDYSKNYLFFIWKKEKKRSRSERIFREFFFLLKMFFSLSPYLSDTYTHTHTHKHLIFQILLNASSNGFSLNNNNKQKKYRQTNIIHLFIHIINRL